MNETGFLHQGAKSLKDEWITPKWITPKWITDELGPFDLDPCSPGTRRPWDTAKTHYALPDNGLELPWEGYTWCNPPYSRETAKWLAKMAEHQNGIALVFARTDTKAFHRHVWEKASAIFFFEGRLTFHHVDGTLASSNSGAPSCLVAYGDHAEWRLKQFRWNHKGKLVRPQFS